MKICFLNDVEFLGGGEVWVLRACRHLQRLGHGVAVACPRGSVLETRCAELGLECLAYAKPTPSAAPEAELREFLERHGVDLLYCTVIGNFCEARALGRIADAVNASRDGNKMAVVLKTGLPPLGNLAPEHYGCGAGAAVRRLHVVAPAVRRAFENWRHVFDDSFVEVFREGIDLERFGRDPEARSRKRRGWHIPDGHTVVTCLARLDGTKGQGVLLRAIPGLLKLHPGTVFVFAGAGPDREITEELASDLGVASAVKFTGHTDDVPALLSASDILCHPSLHDGLPNAVVEAMAADLPVVASRVAGIPDLITDGVSGLLVRPNDVKQLASALDCLLRNEHRQRESFGERGRRLVKESFDLSRNVTALSARLEEELREFQRAPHRATAPACPAEPSRVLFVLNSIRTGGEETELAILARYLDRKKFPMSVLSLSGVAEAAPALEKITAWGVAVDTTCHRIPRYSDKIGYLLTKIREENIRLVVACHDPQLVYEAFAHLAPRECRLIEHGGLLDDVAKIPKDRTARYIGVSPAITDAAAGRMRRRDHAVFIPSMVDTDEFDGADWAAGREWRREWIREVCLRPHGLPDDTCVVVLVARLDPRKRVEDFIRCAAELCRHATPSLFLVVGGPDAFHPDYAGRLEEQARALVESHRMVFTGPRSDVAGILCAADILVVTSTGEGMAHVINEAGAAGLAVVASDDGAAREQLDDGGCGTLFRPGDTAQLTARLAALIEDRPLRRRLGLRLRERVRARYAARVVVERWHSVLEDAVDEMGRTLQ